MTDIEKIKIQSKEEVEILWYLKKISWYRNTLNQLLQNESLESSEISENKAIIKKLNKIIHIIETYSTWYQEYLNNFWASWLSSKYSVFNLSKTAYRALPYNFLVWLKTKALNQMLRESIDLVKDFNHYLRDNKIDEEVLRHSDLFESKVVWEDELETTLTLNYQKKKWSHDRIILDGIQNHLPHDSKWSETSVEFFDQKTHSRVSISNVDGLDSENITKLRFSDDGIWYDLKNLIYFFSTKSDQVESAGQFGEWLKMISAASIRENENIEFESQNRKATPFTKPVVIEWSGEDDNHNLEKLCYKVQHLERKAPFIWSRTTFHNPSKGLVKSAKNIWEKVLYFRKNYTPLQSTSYWDIVSEWKSIYVKWIYISEIEWKTLFSYNFNNIDVNRDRDFVKEKEYTKHISSIIEETNNEETVRKILQYNLLNDSSTLEISGRPNVRYKDLWQKVLCDICEVDDVKKIAVTISSSDDTRSIKAMGYKVFKVSWAAYDLLQSLWALTVDDVAKLEKNYTVETSFTLDYMKEKRWPQKTLIDILQNHLPEDSWWSKINVTLVDKDWRTRNLKSYLWIYGDNTIKDVIFSDNWKWYDVNYVTLLKSWKSKNRSAVWQFGEWLKMAATSALRDWMWLEYKSRNWSAVADKTPINVDWEDSEKLIFHVNEKNTDQVKQGSITKLTNISQWFLKELNGIDKLFLQFNTSIVPVQVLKTKSYPFKANGMNWVVFVKWVRITDKYSENLLFNYSFETDSIVRDRDHIDRKEVQKLVLQLQSKTEDMLYINEIIKAATEEFKDFQDLKTDWEHFEFLKFESVNPWLRADIFKRNFWENAIIVDTQSSKAIEEARYLWYNPIVIKANIWAVLKKWWIRTVSEVIEENNAKFHFIDIEDLSDEEREMLKKHELIDPYLEWNTPVPIKIYTHRDSDTSVKMTLWFWSPTQKIIWIRQSILSDQLEFFDTYIHEKAHQITWAADESREHFTYVSKHYSKMMIAVLKDEWKL